MNFNPELQEIFSDLRIALRVLFGHSFLLSYWAYLNLRLRVVPWLPLAFGVVSAVDFLLLLTEKFLSEDPKIHAWFAELKVILPDGWLHWLGRRMHLNEAQLIVLSVLSICLAMLMVLHHHRVMLRVNQHLSLLNAIRDVAGVTTRVAVVGASSAVEFVEGALKVLTDATVTFKGHRIPFLNKTKRAATVLRYSSDQKTFSLLAQSPSNLYNAALKIEGHDSAAGAVLRKDGIIYIPWTYFPHGVRMWVDTTKSPHALRASLAKNVFVDLGEAGLPKPRSIICTEAKIRGGDGRVRYVICLDSNKFSCFQDVDYQAIALIASLVGIVLKDLPSKGRRA